MRCRLFNPARRIRFGAWPPLSLAIAAIAPAAEIPITVKTVNAGTASGRLLDFSLEGGLAFQPDGESDPVHIDAEDLVFLKTDLPSMPPRSGLSRVDLIGGDLLWGRPTDATPETVTLSTQTLGEIPVPLTQIKAWRSPVAQYPQHRQALAKLTQGADLDDAVLLTNGDIVRGLIVEITPQEIVLEADGNELQLKHGTVVAASLVPLEPKATNELSARIHTVDGQRLTARRLRWSEAGVAATVWSDIVLQVSPDRIARIEIVNGRWRWLSELDPISYEQQSTLGVAWEWRRNRNVMGGILRVGGREFERGIGVHSEASLLYDLQGAYGRFVTSFGLDDDTGSYADVDVEIRVDGQLRFRETSVRPGTLHGPIRIDTANADRVQLSVLFGSNADIQDRFDWIEPALIR